MRKHLNNPWVSGLLGAVALGVVLMQALPGKKSYAPTYYNPGDEGFEESDEFQENVDSAIKGNAFDLPALLELAARLPARDILSRQVAPIDSENDQERPDQYASETLRLQGIWIQGSVRFAAIDGTVLKEGQFHRRARIERIESGGAWIRIDAETRFVEPGQSWTYQYRKSAAESASL